MTLNCLLYITTIARGRLVIYLYNIVALSNSVFIEIRIAIAVAKFIILPGKIGALAIL